MNIKREKSINQHNSCNCNAGCNCDTLPNGCECTTDNKCSDDCTCGESKTCDCGCGSSDCNCDGDCDDPDGRHHKHTDKKASYHLASHTKASTCNDSDCKCHVSNNIVDARGRHNHDMPSDGCDCGKCMSEPILTASSRPSIFTSKRMLISISRIIISVTLIILGSLLKLPDYVDLPFYIVAYLCIGGEYLYMAVRNIFRGKLFNENFLMVIATVGAFAIGEYLEAVLVMELYFIGELLQSYAVDSSRRNISGLLNLKAATANKLINGNLTATPTESLAIGDRIVVSAGEKIPTDGIVILGSSYIDTTALTGESRLRSTAIGDAVLGGTINTSGLLTIEVTRAYCDTSVAKILTLIEQSSDKKPVTEKFITKFAKFYTPIVVLIAAIIAFVPPIFIGFAATFTSYLNKALVFLVISCPCALVISVPLGFFAGIGGASRKSILIKGGNYLEAVNTIDTYVFDKTGTITEGTFTITHVNSPVIPNSELLELVAYAESGSNHPIARSFMSSYSGTIDSSRYSDYQEISGKGITLNIDGAQVICGNAALLLSSNVTADSVDAQGTVIHVAKQGKYLGNIILGDPIRSDSASVVSSLLASGKRVIMLSGDNDAVVSHVARELNISEYHHSLLPEDKAAIVQQLISEGKKVAFIGDGLNDAPVLKLATVGICMSGLSNDASIEASDIVISGGKIGSVTTLIAKAKRTRSVVTQNIVFTLTVKIAIMIISVAFYSSMWLAILADVGVSLLAIINSMRAKK